MTSKYDARVRTRTDREHRKIRKARTRTEREQKNYKSGEQEQNEAKIFVLFFQIKCLVLVLPVQENMSLICKGLKLNVRAKVDWV